MDDLAAPVLEARGIACGYGVKTVVEEANLSLARGEVVALIGHNGAGKSTVLRALFGLLPILRGTLVVHGRPVSFPTPRMMASLGFSYLPQGNRVFTNLSVEENLKISALGISQNSQNEGCVKRMIELFPILAGCLKQIAGALSGGERQTLALAMALMRSPNALLLDEPSSGLAPSSARDALVEIKRVSQEQNVSVMIVEQRTREVLQIATRAYVMRRGRITFEGKATELSAHPDLLRQAFL